MTHIKIERQHVDDARWVGAGGDAFAIHIAGLTWSDQQLTDGRIPVPMASRLSLAVDATRADDAVAILLERGFWKLEGDHYLIADYGTHALGSEEITRTRGRWAADQRRRRGHGNGDHSLCSDPRFCPAVRAGSHVSADSGRDSNGDSTGESRTNTKRLGANVSADSAGDSTVESRTNTIPNKTLLSIPDLKGGYGWEGGAAGRAAPTSADATAARAPGADNRPRNITFTMPPDGGRAG